MTSDGLALLDILREQLETNTDKVLDRLKKNWVYLTRFKTIIKNKIDWFALGFGKKVDELELSCPSGWTETQSWLSDISIRCISKELLPVWASMAAMRLKWALNIKFQLFFSDFASNPYYSVSIKKTAPHIAERLLTSSTRYFSMLSGATRIAIVPKGICEKQKLSLFEMLWNYN